MMSAGNLVLVTGGTGFVASHCIVLLLQRGYHVRTTVRNLQRAEDVRQMLRAGSVTEENVKMVEFCVANLMSDKGWPEACEGCTFVLHVASPFPPGVPKHEDDLIVPAREGTLRALKAAKAAGTVRRVVLTSSFAAVGYGHSERGVDKPFTEEDWTVLVQPQSPIIAYNKSKTIAERAAWDWIEKEGGEMEMAVVNPVAIFGPLLGKDYASSIALVVRMMNGQLPGLPQIAFGVVDVRDVADLHLRAMTNSKAKGNRFIAVAGDFMTVQDIALALKKRMGAKANKVPTRLLPNFVLRLAGLFDASVGLVTPELGKVKNATNEKARNMLGWQPRSAEDALVATAESMDQFGLQK